MTARGCALLLLLFSTAAPAHRASDAFVALRLEADRAYVEWSVALRDLEAAVGIDTDGDRAITWGELRSAQARIAGALPGFIALEADAGACALALADVQVEDRADGRHAWLAVEALCPGAPRQLRYDFLFGLDPTHRAIATVDAAGGRTSTVLSPESPVLDLAAGGATSLGSFTAYLRAGMHHIFIGIDHVLFVVTLLLPATLVARGRGSVSWDVIGLVTAFTVAHSITLALTALGVMRLPGALVESAIALSVTAAALWNLRPHAPRTRTALALVFGLVHGCGLAGALGELGLPVQGRVLALAAFNLGVEAGQLAIVAAVLPVLLLLRGAPLYGRVVVSGGSLVIAAVGALWFLQRSGLVMD